VLRWLRLSVSFHTTPGGEKQPVRLWAENLRPFRQFAQRIENEINLEIDQHVYGTCAKKLYNCYIAGGKTIKGQVC
jgi:hypothetical protein